jgi:hypothetical protein
MKLHEQVKALKTENDALREGIFDLMRYLHSEKFDVDTTVQARDVVHRLQETLNTANERAGQ